MGGRILSHLALLSSGEKKPNSFDSFHVMTQTVTLLLLSQQCFSLKLV